jgi:hypothetical protein
MNTENEKEKDKQGSMQKLLKDRDTSSVRFVTKSVVGVLQG